MSEQTAQDEESTAEPRPTLRRRRLKRVIQGVLILPCLVLLLLAMVPLFVTAEDVRQRMEEELTTRLGLPVHVGKISYSLLRGGELESLRLGAPAGYQEPLLTLGPAKLKYDFSGLLTKKILLKQFLVENPQITLERKDGVLNIERVLANLKSKRSRKPQPSSAQMDRSKPLVPLTIVLKQLLIQDAEVRLAGEGPNLSINRLSYEFAGKIDPSKLEFIQKIRFRDSALRARLPQSETTRFISGDVGVDWSFSLKGETARGLTIHHVGTKLETKIQNLLVERESSDSTRSSEAPPVDIAFSSSASGSPSKNRFEIQAIKAQLGPEEILDAGLSLEGLRAFMKVLVQPKLLTRLENRIGLSTSADDGKLQVDVRSFRLPLKPLQPFAQLFTNAPKLGGEIRAEGLECAGTAEELLGASPAKLGGKILFKDILIRMPDFKVGLGRLNGEVAFGNQAPNPRFKLPWSGEINAKGLAFAEHRIDLAKLKIEGGLESLKYPSTGQTELGLQMHLGQLQSPLAQWAHLDWASRIRGTNALSQKREGLRDVRITSKLSLPSLRAKTGTATVRLRDLTAQFETEIDRLIPYGKQPLRWKLASKIGSFGMGRLGPNGKDIQLGLQGTTQDPRSGMAISPRVEARLKAQMLGQAQHRAESVRFQALMRTQGMELSATTPRGKLPDVVTASISGTLPRIFINHAQTGPMKTKSRFYAKLAGRPKLNRLQVKNFELDVDEFFRMRAEGKLARISSVRPKIDFSLNILPMDLATIVRRAPPKINEMMQGLTAEGRVRATTRVAGSLNLRKEIGIENLPLKLDSMMEFDSISAHAPSAKAKISGLSGKLEAVLSKNRLNIETTAKLEDFIKELPEESVQFSNLDVYLDAGLKDEVWSLSSNLKLDEIKGLGKQLGRGEALGASVEVSYPKYGDLKIHNATLNFPSVGVVGAVKGRLERRRFGALRPKLTVNSRLDFDSLKKFVPDIAALSGRTKAFLSVESEKDTEVGFTGELEFEQFSLARDAILVSGLQGRMPVRQSVRLPPPRPIGKVLKKGLLGDDLEDRLRELIETLQNQSQIVVNKSNILVEAPRTADYEAMRNFYTADASRIRIDRIENAENVLENLSLDASYQSGVFQIDRLAFQVWEGDVFGDMALQLGGEDDVRMRMRMTATDLNMDLLTAKKVGSELSKGLARNDFLFSGVSDIKMDISDQVINGTVDISKLSIPLVIRLVDFKDPDGQDDSLQNIKLPLKIGQGVYTLLFGERLSGMKVWIKQNLLNSSFVWDRPWIGSIRTHEIFLGPVFEGLGLGVLNKTEIPNPITPVARALQLVSQKVSQGKFNLTLADTVQDIRRRNLAEVWANPVWADLRTKLKPLTGRVVIE